MNEIIRDLIASFHVWLSAGDGAAIAEAESFAEQFMEETEIPTLYYYFKPSGKWKYIGEGKSIPQEYAGRSLTHGDIYEINDGSLPGLNHYTTDLTIVVLDPNTFPRMIKATTND